MKNGLQVVVRISSYILAVFGCSCMAQSTPQLELRDTPAAAGGMQQTLAELDATPTPQGADPATFAMLKRELRAMLIARSAGKLTAAAPSTIRSKVTNLFVVPSLSGSRFTWTYKNEGDYNQNGTVNISDLAILGIHYGKDTSSGDWALARPADGNGDGQINIGDLASIGIGFGRVVTRYLLEHSTESGTGAVWSTADEVLLSESEVDLDGLRKFDHYLPSLADGYYRVVPCHMELAGIPSDAVVWGLDGPGDWFMFGHDRRHTGRSLFTAPADNHLRWSYTTQSMYCSSSPAVSVSGTVYFGGDDEHRLYAVNQDGTQQWAYTAASEVDSSPAVGPDGTLFVGTFDGLLTAINPDGSTKWAFDTGGAVSGSPAISADGTIYIGSQNGSLYALTPLGGQLWNYSTGSGINSSAAIGTDGTIYVGSDDWKLHAVNPDGSQRWTYMTGNWIHSSPAIGDDGTIYIGSADCKLHAVNADGSPRWTYSTGDLITASPAVATDGTIYIGSHDALLYALNPDGSLKWTYTTGSYISASAAISADGTVIIGSDDANVYALHPDGTTRWIYTTGESIATSPAIGADGTVYIANWHALFAIGPGGA